MYLLEMISPKQSIEKTRKMLILRWSKLAQIEHVASYIFENY